MAESVAPLRVGLLGNGTVGAAFQTLLEGSGSQFAALTGRNPEINGVLTRSSGDFESLLAGSDVIVELIGGLDPAKQYVSQALAAGKPVITANKQLIATHGEELFDLARVNSAYIGFEAAVAGVVPAIRVLRESLAAQRVERIHGIVNGTTNFILSAMSRTGADYETALAEAQQLGYAEADPGEDVNGKDAAAKMAILARLGFDTAVDLSQVSFEGIEQITPDDIAYAQELGLSLKLIGTAERVGSKIAVRVHPAFLYAGHPLASVDGPYNAVTIESDQITEITLSGPGAGGPQTAAAVFGDLVTAVRAPFAVPEAGSSLELASDAESAFYLHTEVADKPGVLAEIASGLADHGVSIKSVVQRGMGSDARLVLVVHRVLESEFFAALDKLAELDSLRGKPSAIRVIEEQFR